VRFRYDGFGKYACPRWQVFSRKGLRLMVEQGAFHRVLRSKCEVEESLLHSGISNRVLVETGKSSGIFTLAPRETAERAVKLRGEGVDVQLTHRVVLQGPGDEQQVLEGGGVPYLIVDPNGCRDPQSG